MPARRKLRQDELFVLVFKTAMRLLAGDTQLTASQWRTIAACLSASEYGGYISASQQELAQWAGLSPAQMSRNLQTLVSKGILLREHRGVHNQWRYRFVTTLAYVGDIGSLVWQRLRDRQQLEAATRSDGHALAGS